ncbi:MAG: hypothetical protein AAFR61_25505 [Bacteroidota bacterium]
MKNLLLILCLCTALLGEAFSQDGGPQLPLRISLFTHSIGMPFKTAIKRPLNWGVSVGTTYFYRKGDNHSWGQGFDLAWYRHKNLDQGLMLRTSFRYEYTTPFGLTAGPIVSLGYLLTLNEREMYRLNERGAYEPIPLASRSSLMIGIGGRLGFDLSKVSNSLLKPYIEYDWAAQTPHSQITSVFPHSMVHIGAIYPFGQP